MSFEEESLSDAERNEAIYYDFMNDIICDQICKQQQELEKK